MKYSIIILLIANLPFSMMAQFQTGEEVRITESHNDDLYLAGGDISVEAPVFGDLVLAGGNIELTDSISEDLLLAGGDVDVMGNVAGDIRVAGGKILINSEVGDDLIVFGGEVEIGENAIIHGNIISFAGKVKMKGTIMGNMKCTGGLIDIDGSVHGFAKLIADEIRIRERAVFHSNVDYWSENGTVDFKKSVLNGHANFDKEMAWEDVQNDWSMGAFGIFLFFVTFVFSGFIIISFIHWAFKNRFTGASKIIEEETWKSLGFGLIWLILLPLLILVSFVLVIGIPIGLFLSVFYVLSLAIGQLVVSLMFVYYLKRKKDWIWSFWKTSVVSLMVAIGLYIATMIPILGGVVAFVLIAITYGALILSIREQQLRKKLSLQE